MVKKFHPDLNDSGSNEKIIELNEAYSVLKNFLSNSPMNKLIKKRIPKKIKCPTQVFRQKKYLI